jgi:hypothetical protein
VRKFFSAVRDTVTGKRRAKMAGVMKELFDFRRSHGKNGMICGAGQNDFFHKRNVPYIKLTYCSTITSERKIARIKS